MPEAIVHRDWTCGTGDWVGWYRASPAQLADAWTTYAEWRAHWWQSEPEPITEVHRSGAEMVAQLEPGYVSWILAETNSEWTAVLGGNKLDWTVSDLVPCLLVDIESGRDADGLVSRLFRATGQPTQFRDVMDFTRPDRIVTCEQEKRGWAFRDSGQPLEFEETDRYLLRDRSERLTTDMLRRYADALGIPLGEDEVLTGHGLHIREVPYYHENCIDRAAARQELVRLHESRQ